METISFTVIVQKDESRRHGIFLGFFMLDKDSKKCCKFCQCSECVCNDRTDRQFKSNNQTLQGTTIMQRKIIHTHFCVVAWEMEGINKITDLFNIFHFGLDESE